MEEKQECETLPELVIKTKTLWRAHASLNRKGVRVAQRGDVKEFAWMSDEAKEILSAQGALSRVSGPPLSALPGWKTRAAKLKPLGIEKVEQLLGVDDKALGARIDRKPETIARWKTEAMDWLLAPAYSG